jgi:hypothetical protein
MGLGFLEADNVGFFLRNELGSRPFFIDCTDTVDVPGINLHRTIVPWSPVDERC